MLTSRSSVMGGHVNRRRTTITAGASAAVITAVNVLMLYQQFCGG